MILNTGQSCRLKSEGNLHDNVLVIIVIHQLATVVCYCALNHHWFPNRGQLIVACWMPIALCASKEAIFILFALTKGWSRGIDRFFCVNLDLVDYEGLRACFVFINEKHARFRIISLWILAVHFELSL